MFWKNKDNVDTDYATKRDAELWREHKEKELEAQKKLKAKLHLTITLVTGEEISEEYTYEYLDYLGSARKVVDHQLSEVFGRHGETGIKFENAFIPYTSILKIEHTIEEFE